MMFKIIFFFILDVPAGNNVVMAPSVGEIAIQQSQPQQPTISNPQTQHPSFLSTSHQQIGGSSMPQSQMTIPQQKPQHPVPSTLQQQQQQPTVAPPSSIPQQQQDSDLPQTLQTPSTTQPEMVISHPQTSQQPVATIMPQQQQQQPSNNTPTATPAVPINYPSLNANSKYKF